MGKFFQSLDTHKDTLKKYFAPDGAKAPTKPEKTNPQAGEKDDGKKQE
jgi:hypothetical protein